MARTDPITFRDYAAFLRRYLKGRLHLVLVLAVILFINIGLQIYNPQILRRFIDAATSGQPVEQLIRMGLTFIAIAFGHQLINVVVVYVTENLGWATTNDLRMDLARHTLGLDMSFHTGHTPGEMIERLDGDVMSLSNFFSQFILQVFGNLVLVVGVLVVLAFEDWRISLALLVFIIITIIVLLRLANIAVSSWEAERQSSAGLFGFLEERLSGTEDIRSNNAKNYVLDRFYRLTRDLMRKTIKAGLKMNILLNTTWILFAIGDAVAILISAALFYSGKLTLGTVYMIIYYTTMINWPLERITQQMQDLQRAGASLVRIMGIQRIQGRIPGENNFILPAEKHLTAGPLAVRFDRVTFSYNDSLPAAPGNGRSGEKAALQAARVLNDPEDDVADESAAAGAAKEIVLQDISFNLNAGRVIGLLGRTGSGKTTLTRLLFRLYDPDEGSIHLGSNSKALDIRQLPLPELRRSVGMVTQNIQLFHATVRENLTFFDPSIPDERVIEAIRDLGLERWYDSLPNGLDTELSSGGGGLSAGEAQLLAFTRIFLRDPGLVILDEATSRLDPATEYLIEQAVEKLTRQRTAIIVAHHLGTVQRADDILILEDGRILEHGERARLAADPASRFYHLLETGMEEVLV
jgi:ABC-type multidrug transport system fused ATPase/permease subunit